MLKRFFKGNPRVRMLQVVGGTPTFRNDSFSSGKICLDCFYFLFFFFLRVRHLRLGQRKDDLVVG